MIHTTDLNWEVKQSKLYTADGQQVENYQVIQRSDNNNILHVAKESYTPTSNAKFKNLVKSISDFGGFELKGFGEYAGGKKVLAYMQNIEKPKIQGYDFHEYLIVGNGHDGQTPLFIATSNIMLRCRNQFGKYLSSARSQGLVVYHTKHQDAYITDIKAIFENYYLETKELYELYDNLSKVKIDKTLMDSLTKRLLDAEEEEISTRKKNQIDSIMLSVKKETSVLGDTAFGYFNGITHYTTHTIEKNNVLGNLYGVAGKLNQRALELVKELV